MKFFLKEILCLTIVFLLLDIVCVGLIKKKIYSILLEEIQGREIESRPFAKLLSYVVILFGLYYFVIKSTKRKFDIWNTLSFSLPYALTIYGVFNFRIVSMIKKWDYLIVFYDILWGCFICSFSSIIVGLYRKYYKDDNQNIFSQNLFLN
jgi:uncharacterized membrane protein